nr:enoyl-CoA hydratase [Peribacillus kribbensis]
MPQFVSVEKDNHIAVITIQNPPLNVLSKAVFLSLREAFTELEGDGETTAVIVTGSGEKAFAAGADIKEFPELMYNPEMLGSVMETHEVLTYIEQFPKPTIAVLNGMTFGGGCELSLAMDMRIAEQHAQIGLPEVKLGLFPGGGGTQRLPRLIGAPKAKELMYTGDPVDAEAALSLGLVNKVVPTGEGLLHAKRLAERCARHSLQSLSRIKRAVNKGLDRSLQEGLELEAQLFTDIFKTEDIKEGVQAFIEKRKPVFQNK